MLRIHIEERSESATIRLEGKLAGDWVEEVERCCHEVLARRRHRTLIIELDEVMFVDAKGQILLRQMFRAGAVLRGRGMHSQYLVEQIQQRVAG
jgi:anti-anti-sigma regulatory factor